MRVPSRGWPLLVFVAMGCAVPEAATSPPSTDIWLVELGEPGGLTSAPENLTHREGYDDQPAFLPDGTGFLYASSDGEQVDVWRWGFAAGSGRAVTRTPESEYSPQPIPGDGGFSVVRVESNDADDQRLWRFDADGTNPRLLIEREYSVEYYRWVEPGLVALRVQGDPNKLKFADPEIGAVERDPAARAVGRTLAAMPDANALTFVHKLSTGHWWVRNLDLSTRDVTDVTEVRPGCEDFAWTPDGTLLIADGTTILEFSPGRGWGELADFSAAGIGRIGRLAVAPDGRRLLFVAQRPGGP
jgi:hypothetical protein